MRSVWIIALVLLPACGHSRIAATPSERPAPALDVVELGAVEAERRLAAGELSARALTEAYLARIAEIDRAGPTLRSIIELNPEALAEADALDAARREGKLGGPLHGLPVLLKDNIDAVGMVCSAGSLALADNRPTRDAFIVARLRAAGAVILGKTNLSEWANFRSTRSSSGWSSRGGQTLNPYVLDRSPSGSSSGTAAAIASSLAALGVGTETDGSILSPSSVTGIVGMKPTVGLVSRDGIVPIAISQDTAGPMGRTVADVALLMNVLAGVDETDPRGPEARGKIPEDYRASLQGDALAGKRIGVVRQSMGFHPDVDAMVERAIATIKSAGGVVVDVTIPAWKEWEAPELDVLLYEFKAGIGAYLARAGRPESSLATLIEWNKAHAEEAMPFFGQEMFVMAAAKGPLTDRAYLEAHDKAARLAGKDGLVAALDGAHLDALIAPADAPAWPIDHLLGDHFLGGGYGLAAVAGTPSITVPAGATHGLPLGLLFMGRAYSEAELLGLAYAFEQATHARTPPKFLPTLKW